jgi:hypothetical protein
MWQACKKLQENLEVKKNHLDYLSVHGRMILKWIGIEEICWEGVH